MSKPPAATAASAANASPHATGTSLPAPPAIGLPMLVIETTAHLRAKAERTGSAATSPRMASGVALVLPPGPATSCDVTAIDPALCRIQVQEYEAGLTRGGDLVSAIATLMQNAGLPPSALASIGVNIGPGSWTGLRIGLTAAKTLAAAGGVPLVAIEGLLATALMLFQHASTDLRVAVIQDSGHGRLCRGVYRNGPDGWPVTETPPAMIEVTRMAETFAAGPGVLLGVDSLPAATRALWDAAFPVLPAGWMGERRSFGLAETAQACVTAARFGRLIYTAGTLHSLAPLYLKDPYSS